MNKDENKRLAEWLGVPCWHEWEWVKSNVHYAGGWWCPLCDKVIEWNDNIPAEWEPTNPDYYTPEGFFALLAGLRAKELLVIIDCNPGVKDKSEVAIYDGSVLVACALDPDLPTALVEAAIQAMEASDG